MDELSLKDIVTLLWKGKKLIAIIVAAFIIMGLVYCFIIVKPEYEAKAVLEINPVDLTKIGKVGTLPEIVAYIAQEPSKSIIEYSEQIKSDTILAAAAESINYDAKKGSYISLMRSKVTVSSVEKTNLITIIFKDKNGSVAVNGANAVADAFVLHVSEAIKKNDVFAYDFITKLYKDESETLAKNTEFLNEFWAKPRGVSEVQNELNSSISRIDDYKKKLLDLDIKISYNKAGLAATRKILEDTPEFVTIIEKSIKEQTPNSSYIALVNRINNYEIAINVDQVKVSLYKRALNDLQNGIADLREELNLKKAKNDDLYTEYNRSKEASALYKSELEILETRISADIGRKCVIKSTEAVGYKVIGTSKATIMILVVIIGIMLGVFIVFIKYTWTAQARAEQDSKSIK